MRLLRTLIVFGIVLQTVLCLGQSDTSYFYKSFSVGKKSEANHYKIVTYRSADSIEAFETNYYMDHSIKSRRFYSNYPDKILEGKVMSWNESGWVKSIERYENDTLHGESLAMDSLGKLDIKLFYNRGELLFWERKQKDGAFKKQDAPYLTMPIFPGCEELTNEEDRRECSNTAIFNIIQSTAKYPTVSRDQGVSGTVYISYIVNKQGWVKEASILKMIGGNEHIAKAALDTIFGFPQYIPGTRGGKIVEITYNVPVRFKLR